MGKKAKRCQREKINIFALFFGMVYGGYSYISKEYEPSEDDFVTILWVKGIKDIETLAEGIAAESSVGTWTSLATMNSFVWNNLRARIFKIIKTGKNSGFVFIAYPLEHFDNANLLQLLASIRGNIFGMKELEELYILDWVIPKKYQKNFHGPSWGIEKIRKYLGTDKSKRPHVGTIVKPKVGLSPKEFAEVAYKSFSNGLDLVKDDENLVNQKFCPWEDRVIKVIDAAEKARDETGENKIYVPNITDFLPKMLDRIDFLVEHGWRMCMVDVYVVGISGLKELLDETHKKKILVHAHRAGYAAEARGKFGVSFAFWLKIYKMLGVDQIHVGTGVGKMEGSPIFIRKYAEIAREGKIEGIEPIFANFEWSEKIKSVMPVASGGLSPGLVEAVVEVYGSKDLTIQAGGGVHGHTKGTAAGAKAMREAVEIVARGESFRDAKKSEELKEALKKWGYLPKEKVSEVFERFKKENWVEKIRKEGWEAIEKMNKELVVK